MRVRVCMFVKDDYSHCFDDVLAEEVAPFFFSFFLITFLNLETPLGVCDAVRFIKHHKCVHTFVGGFTGQGPLQSDVPGADPDSASKSHLSVLFPGNVSISIPHSLASTAVKLFIKSRNTA